MYIFHFRDNSVKNIRKFVFFYIDTEYICILNGNILPIRYIKLYIMHLRILRIEWNYKKHLARRLFHGRTLRYFQIFDCRRLVLSFIKSYQWWAIKSYASYLLSDHRSSDWSVSVWLQRREESSTMSRIWGTARCQRPRYRNRCPRG